MRSNLKVSLLSLRLTVFLVMFIWTLDKIVRPQHATSVFTHFYSISIGSGVMSVLAILEMALVFAFVLGIRKRLAYGLILLFNAVSTLASFRQFIYPFEKSNLLFFAAWPLLAACFSLYLLRNEDTLLTVKRLR